MFDFIVVVAVIFFFIGSALIAKGKGSKKSPVAVVGFFVVLASLLTIPLHYWGVI